MSELLVLFQRCACQNGMTSCWENSCHQSIRSAHMRLYKISHAAEFENIWKQAWFKNACEGDPAGKFPSYTSESWVLWIRVARQRISQSMSKIKCKIVSDTKVGRHNNMRAKCKYVNAKTALGVLNNFTNVCFCSLSSSLWNQDSSKGSGKYFRAIL